MAGRRRRKSASRFRAGHGQIAAWAICGVAAVLLLALGSWVVNRLVLPGLEPAKPAAAVPVSVSLPPPAESEPEPPLSALLRPALEAVPLHSQTLLLTERESGEVLFAIAPDRAMPPASMTKIMTALVAIEQLDDLDTKIVLPSALFVPLYQANASMAGFLPEEAVAARDLLYATLLPSAAEAATGLAIAVAGDEPAFVAQMNARAASLGMTDTHFANVTGLDDPALSATASDMTTLLRAALKNKTFRTVFTTARRQIAPSALHPDGIVLESTLFSRLESPDVAGGRLLGGKTGTTENAGMCLASLAELDEKEYLLVTFGASGDPKTEWNHLSDHVAVYEALFTALCSLP